MADEFDYYESCRACCNNFDPDTDPRAVCGSDFGKLMQEWFGSTSTEATHEAINKAAQAVDSGCLKHAGEACAELNEKCGTLMKEPLKSLFDPETGKLRADVTLEEIKEAITSVCGRASMMHCAFACMMLLALAASVVIVYEMDSKSTAEVASARKLLKSAEKFLKSAKPHLKSASPNISAAVIAITAAKGYIENAIDLLDSAEKRASRLTAYGAVTAVFGVASAGVFGVMALSGYAATSAGSAMATVVIADGCSAVLGSAITGTGVYAIARGIQTKKDVAEVRKLVDVQQKAVAALQALLPSSPAA